MVVVEGGRVVVVDVMAGAAVVVGAVVVTLGAVGATVDTESSPVRGPSGIDEEVVEVELSTGSVVLGLSLIHI